jgi:hypothetical protein
MEGKSEFSPKKDVSVTDIQDDLNEIEKGLFLGENFHWIKFL